MDLTWLSWTLRRKLDTRAVPVMFARCSSEDLTCVDFGLAQKTFARMRSEGFSFDFEGLGAERCSLDVAFVPATVCNRDDCAMVVPLALLEVSIVT